MCDLKVEDWPLVQYMTRDSHPRHVAGWEGMRKSRDDQKHLAQSRKGAEVEKKIEELFIVSLYVSASLREFADFFTSSAARVSSWPGWPGHELFQGRDRQTADLNDRSALRTSARGFTVAAAGVGHDVLSPSLASLVAPFLRVGNYEREL